MALLTSHAWPAGHSDNGGCRGVHPSGSAVHTAHTVSTVTVCLCEWPFFAGCLVVVDSLKMLTKAGMIYHKVTRCWFLLGSVYENLSRSHGGRRPSGEDSSHSSTVIPPSALDKPSIMKRYHRRRTTRCGVTARLPTIVTLHDTRFVECR